jgi:hypothetical protein
MAIQKNTGHQPNNCWPAVFQDLEEWKQSINVFGGSSYYRMLGKVRHPIVRTSSPKRLLDCSLDSILLPCANTCEVTDPVLHFLVAHSIIMAQLLLGGISRRFFVGGGIAMALILPDPAGQRGTKIPCHWPWTGRPRSSHPHHISPFIHVQFIKMRSESESSSNSLVRVQN